MSAKPASLPLIIGHRGSSAVAPENTIAAFKRALHDGVDGVEFDVRLARDGVPVVIHDATLRRTAQMKGAVRDFTGSELTEIDVGSWFNRRHPTAAQREYQRETIPTLKQLFEVFRQNDALLYLELKSDKNQAHDLAASALELIKGYGFAGRVMVECFDLRTLAAVRSIDPQILIAPLFDRTLRHPNSFPGGRRIVQLARQLGAAELALHRSLINPELIARASASSLPVVVWTTDDPRWVSRAKSMGVKGLITNDPQKMIEARARLSIH